MASLVRHGTLGTISAWKDQEGNLHHYFVAKENEVGWLWSDTTGVMVDAAANWPSFEDGPV